jgi:acetyl-CoA C-acetyltransferase
MIPITKRFLASGVKRTNVVIVGGKRTVFGTFMGGLSELSATHLGTVAAKAALASCNVDPAEVEEVYMGCVLQAGMG